MTPTTADVELPSNKVYLNGMTCVCPTLVFGKLINSSALASCDCMPTRTHMAINTAIAVGAPRLRLLFICPTSVVVACCPLTIETYVE